MKTLQKLGMLAILCGFCFVLAMRAETASAPLVDPRQSTIGAELTNAPDGHGVLINHVSRKSPAEQAGLRDGDVVLTMDGASVRTQDELIDHVHALTPGRSITLDIQRGGKSMSVSVTVEERGKVYNKDVYLPLAEKGDAAAQYDLGHYYHDDADSHDYAQAMIWYSKAADQGNVLAELNLGLMYWVGEGLDTPSSYIQARARDRKAADQFRKAADQGNAYAEYMMGEILCVSYLHLEMKKPDCNQGIKWLEKAASQDNADADYLLARIYEDGQGVKKDPQQAAQWKQKAKNLEAKQKANSFAVFRKTAAQWRALAVKPEMPEEARKERVLAESYLREKDFKGAIQHYEAGLKIDSTWPEGWFNLALLYGEIGNYTMAADRMKHYLELKPDAPDAQSAKDKIVIWEDKANHK